MFIGREYELKKLNEMYMSDKFEFAVIYGRRRVGKSTLIKEFCKDKKAIYYMGVVAGSQNNIDGLSAAILNAQGQTMPYASFQSYENILNFIDSIAHERVVLAIDEYPYLAEDYKSLTSLIQQHIDMKWKDSKLMLILCGSSMSFMENQILGYKSPLYGRRTAQFRINPFKYYELTQFNWTYTHEEQALIYGLTGGIGEYLSFVDSNLPIEENIRRIYLEPAGRMFEEPTNLLKQELNEPRMYHTILNAIAAGNSTLNNIANKAKESTSACTYHLNSLQALDIVEKVTPVGEKESSRKSIYKIKDPAFRFWYRFVFPYQTFIVNGNGEYVYQNVIKANLNDFMRSVFEDMCESYMLHPKTLSEVPFPFTEIGHWWGNNPMLKRQEEIDICALGMDAVLLGECKWRNELIKPDVLKMLMSKGELFHQNLKHYYLFSKSGFATSIETEAKETDYIHLISLDKMYSL